MKRTRAPKSPLTGMQAHAAHAKVRLGMTRRQLAAARGTTPQAVKKLWARARKRLKRQQLDRYARLLAGGTPRRIKPLTVRFA